MILLNGPHLFLSFFGPAALIGRQCEFVELFPKGNLPVRIALLRQKSRAIQSLDLLRRKIRI